MNLSLQPLQIPRHDRSGFDCGNDAVNAFLHEQARRQMAQQVNRTWVLVDAAPGTVTSLPIVGFFTLTHGTVRRAELPVLAQRNRFPLYPLPVIKLAWLGVTLDHQRSAQRIGETLLLEALHTARFIVAQTGLGIAVVTDPLTDASDAFFRHYGFLPLDRAFAQRQTLFLPMGTIQQLDR